MILEHGIYTAALAILIAMVYELYTKKNNSLLIAGIVWVAMCIPDTDYIISVAVTALVGSPYFFEHGDFHNVFCLVLFAMVGGVWVTQRYKDLSLNLVMTCISIGFLPVPVSSHCIP